MNLLTAGVMRGMLGASSCMKVADVSMGVYRKAESKGDTGAMQQAFGYAAGSMNSAKENSENARESLEAAQTKAKEQEKAEQQAALEQKAQGATAANQQTPDPSRLADTVEISNQGRSAAQANGQIAAVQGAAPQTNPDTTEESFNNSETEAKIYTPEGDIKFLNIEAKLSVSGNETSWHPRRFFL